MIGAVRPVLAGPRICAEVICARHESGVPMRVWVQSDKIREGYANFAIADPPLKLILFTGMGKPGSQPRRRRGSNDRGSRRRDRRVVDQLGCGDERPFYHDQRYRERLPLADRHLLQRCPTSRRRAEYRLEQDPCKLLIQVVI